MDDPTSWVPLPTQPLPVDLFWDQFWSIANYFTPFVFSVLGLVLATVVVRLVIKAAFGK